MANGVELDVIHVERLSNRLGHRCLARAGGTDQD